MEREKFLKILTEMHMVCRDVNKKIQLENPDNKLRYEVLQFSNLARHWDSVYRIADFYNNNWLGNKDFMHIPDFEQVLQNCLSYPIIIAREEGSDEILGISAIKYDENTSEDMDPYFPEEDAKYFSVTGILVKKGNPHRGMGKKIYEIAIRGAQEYNKSYPDTRIMCVIDCRNRQSLSALSTAVENINRSGTLGENMELPANIVGYYELRGTEQNDLQEAPTLVLEVGLNPREKAQKDAEKQTFEYNQEEGKTLFDSLRDELKEKIKTYGLNSPVVMQDDDSGVVHYYSLSRECSLVGTQIISNGTEDGNNRTPIYDKKMHEFIGPIQSIAVDEDEEVR